MARRNDDLLLAVASALVLGVTVLLLPSAMAVRVALGLPVLLFCPGYSITAALFPRRDDLDPIERVALSVGLSVAVTILAGLALSYSPWGIRLNPLLISLTLLILIGAASALARRRQVPDVDAFGIALRPRVPSVTRPRAGDVLFAAVVITAIAGAGAGAWLLVASRDDAERFTEFYALGTGGIVDGYPADATVGEEVAVVLGVVNHEGATARYRIEVSIDGRPAGRVDGIALSDGATWEDVVSAVPAHPGPGQKIEFLLYKEGARPPYRKLHIFVDVTSPDGDADRTARARPAVLAFRGCSASLPA